MLGPQAHGEIIKLIEFAFIGERFMAQALPDDVQGLDIFLVIAVDIPVAAPKIRFEHAAAPDAYFEPPITQMVEHTNLFDEP